MLLAPAASIAKREGLSDGGPTEIFDPRDPDAGWELCSTMSIPRGYHSAAILLADGGVLLGRDRRDRADTAGRQRRPTRALPAVHRDGRPGTFARALDPPLVTQPRERRGTSTQMI
jgi:hypothetical protein